MGDRRHIRIPRDHAPRLRSGQAFLELVITLPILIIIIFGIIQLSLLYVAKEMNKFAAFAAARSLVVEPASIERASGAAILASAPSSFRASAILSSALKGAFGSGAKLSMPPLPAGIGEAAAFLDKYLYSYMTTQVRVVGREGNSATPARGEEITVEVTNWAYLPVPIINRIIGKGIEDMVSESDAFKESAGALKSYAGPAIDEAKNIIDEVDSGISGLQNQINSMRKQCDIAYKSAAGSVDEFNAVIAGTVDKLRTACDGLNASASALGASAGVIRDTASNLGISVDISTPELPGCDGVSTGSFDTSSLKAARQSCYDMAGSAGAGLSSARDRLSGMRQSVEDVGNRAEEEVKSGLRKMNPGLYFYPVRSACTMTVEADSSVSSGISDLPKNCYFVKNEGTEEEQRLSASQVEKIEFFNSRTGKYETRYRNKAGRKEFVARRCT